MAFLSPNVKKLVTTGLVVVCIIVLFFLPEIVSLTKSVDTSTFNFSDDNTSNKMTTKQFAEQQNQNEYHNQQIAYVSTSPLEEVLYLIDSGYIEAVPGGVKQKQYAKEEIKEVTWSDLQTKEVKNIFKGIKAKAMPIARDLGDGFKIQRNAVLRFINALDMIQNEASGLMSAPDAVQYLQNSYINVTNHLTDNSIDRDIYLRWTEISLGPLFESPSLQQARARRAYNPRLTLTRVFISQSRSSQGQLDVSARPNLVIEGYVYGNDTKKIEIYHNQDFVKKILIQGRRFSEGSEGDAAVARKHRILAGNLDARGIYTLKASDKDGNVSYKRYNFYPRVLSVGKWPGQMQNFVLPYPSGDPRIDKLFLVGYSGSRNGPARFFSRIGISEF